MALTAAKAGNLHKSAELDRCKNALATKGIMANLFGSTIIYGGGEGPERFSPDTSAHQVAAFKNKRWLEFAQLQDFKLKVKTQFPQFRFELVGDGEDPPDYIVRRDGRAFGLELTAFTTRHRQREFAYFTKIQNKFLDHYRNGRMKRLTGLAIELTLERSADGRLPVLSEAVLNGLVREFERVSRISRKPLKDHSVMSPSIAPIGVSGAVEYVKWMVVGQSNVPVRGNALANETGFNIGFAHQQDLDATTVEDRLKEIIARKDTEKSEELLITAGPNVDGWLLHEDGASLMQCMRTWGGIEPPTHLRRIYANIQGLNCMYVLYDAESKKTIKE